MISPNPRKSIHPQEVALYKLLAHPARLAILNVLRTGEECVCHLEAVLGYRQAYLSQQLALLREAGLIIDRRDGWNIYYQVIAPDIYAVIDAVRAASSPGDPQPLQRQSVPKCPCPKCNAKSDKMTY